MRHFLAAFFEVLGVFIFCCAVFFCLINSTPGKAQLAEMVNILTDNQVTITGLTGFLPTDFSIKNLTLTQKNGYQTVLTDVHIEFSPLKLWHLDLYFSQISIGAVKFVRETRQRLQIRPPPTTTTALHLFRFLKLPEHLSWQIANLKINRFFLPTLKNTEWQKENPFPESFGLQGHILLRKNNADILITSLSTKRKKKVSSLLPNKSLHLLFRIQGPASALLTTFQLLTLRNNKPYLTLKATGLINLITQKITIFSKLKARVFFQQETPKASFFGQQLTANASLTGTLQEPIFKFKATANRFTSVKFNFPYPLHLYLTGKVKDNTLFLQKATLTTKESSISLKGYIRINRNNYLASAADLTAYATLHNLKDIFPCLSGEIQTKAILKGTEKNRYFSLQSSGILQNSPLSIHFTGHLIKHSKLILKVYQSHWKSIHLIGKVILPPTLQSVSKAKGKLLLKIGQLGVLSNNQVTGRVLAKLIVTNQIHFFVLLKNLRSHQGFYLNSAALKAEGMPEALHFSLFATGKSELSAKGLFNLINQQAELLSITGQEGSENLTLLRPFLIKTRPFLQSSPSFWQLSHVIRKRSVLGGIVSLDFSLPGNRHFTLGADFREVSLPQLTSLFQIPIWQGFVSGKLSLHGSLPFDFSPKKNKAEIISPEVFGSLSLSGKDIFPTESKDFLPAFVLNSHIHFLGSQALLSLVFKNSADETSLYGKVPLFSSEKPVDLILKTKLNLTLFNSALSVTGQQLEGSLNGLIHMTGSLKHPLLNGDLDLHNGSFTDFNTGFNLANTDLAIIVKNSVFTVNHLNITAGSGKITAAGHFSPLERGIPVLLSFYIDRAAPFSTDLLNGNLSGEITLSGLLQKMLYLKGQLLINKAQFNIPSSLPPDVAFLEVRKQESHIETEKPQKPRITFDLAAFAPGSVFVTGRGIFANFGGTVHLTGTDLNPMLTGALTLNRGHLNLGSTTLTLSNGRIIFNGAPLNDPTLNLSASNTSFNSAGQVTATLTIAGTLQAPKFLLSSSPDMPTDQILSQLIFGAPRADLGPFELTTLAEVMADLSDWNSAADFNPVASVQKALGLNQLTIIKNSQGSESLEVGKYVAHNLYIGASKNLTSSDGGASSASLNLGHGFTLNTTISTAPDTGSSLGLSYTHQY